MGFAAHRKRKAKRGRRRELYLETLKHGRYPRNSKLNEKVSASICQWLAKGNTLEVAATMSGISRSSLWQWMRAGDSDPDGPYGQLARDVAYAQDLAHARMVAKLIDHDDWRATSFIMKNRWPKLYRDHIVQEMTGPDGGPVGMSVQSFNVVLELHSKEGNGEQPESTESAEPKFRIDGAAADLPDLEESAGAGGG